MDARWHDPRRHSTSALSTTPNINSQDETV
jgi:hypothetical protein